MIRSKQEHIDNIMDYFDFRKVADTMQFLNWKWAYSDTGIPEEPELRKTARNTLSTVYDYGSQQGRKYTMATGGFVYSYDPAHSELTLTFELTGWSSHEGFGSPF